MQLQDQKQDNVGAPLNTCFPPLLPFHQNYFEPAYEAFAPRTLWSLIECIHVGVQEAHARSPVPTEREAGKISAGLLKQLSTLR